MMQSLLARLKGSPVTTALIAVNVLVFLAAERSGSTLETATLIRFGAVSRPAVWGGEPWRMFTAMFLHIGVIHLVWNAYAGFSFCAQAERAFGRGWFLAVYLLSGLAGSAVSVIAQDVVSAGASGALFGVIGVDFAFHYRRLGTLKAFFADQTVRAQLFNLAVWFVIGMTALRMDNWAHGGGLFGGLLLTLALTSKRGIPARVAAVAAILGLVALALRPLPVLHRVAGAVVAARAASQRGDAAEAVRLTDGVDLAPADARARGNDLMKLDRYRDAEDVASALIARSPVDAHALYLRARARIAQKDFAGAIDDLDRSIAITPGFAYAYFLRGSAHHELGQLDLARVDGENTTRRDPKSCNGWWLRGLVDADATNRAAHYTQALAFCPEGDKASLFSNRSSAWLEAGKLDEADKDVTEALERSPRDATLHYQRCAIAFRRPDSAVAESACSEALRLDPTLVRARFARGDLFLSQAKYAEAIADFDALLFADAQDFSARLGRGKALVRSLDADGALADAETLVASGELPGDAYLLRAQARLLKNDRPGARADLEEALARAPEDWKERPVAEELLRTLSRR